MPYIGNQGIGSYTSMSKQDITGVTGSPVKRGFVLSYAVANSFELAVFVNNVRQEPTTAYSASGTVLTMTGDVETTDDFYVIYIGKAIGTINPPDGSVGTAKIADDAVSTAKIANSAVNLTSKVTGVLPIANGGTGHSTLYPQIALITDTKSQNTAGGTFTSGAWQTRTLNTESSDLNNICSLSSNIFTLSSGTYLIEWTAPAHDVERNQSRLYDTTNSAVIQYGSSNYTSSAADVQNSSVGSANVVISSNTGYRIEHIAQNSKSTQGFGVEANLATEIYTQVKIMKIG